MISLFTQGLMMIYWMTHKEHGRHPATGAEVEALKLAGWVMSAPKGKELEKSTAIESPKRGRPSKAK